MSDVFASAATSSGKHYQCLPHARAARARLGLRSPIRSGACEHAFGGGKRARRARGWGHPFTLSTTGSSTTVTTHYTYDALGHLLTTQTKFNPARSTTCTPTGKRATVTDEDGRLTKYAYDELDRLTTTMYPDGTTTAQSYDAANHLLSAADKPNHFAPIGQ